MNENIKYITYQSFPSYKANTIQTFDNIKYMCKKVPKVDLIFPSREKSSSDNKKELAKYYFLPENLSIKATKHRYPFGKFKYFEKISYTISHFLWARKECKNFSEINNLNTIFLTRSDWVFYNLSKKNLNVTFECHQLSKIRKLNIKRSIKFKNSKIIFLNKKLATDSKINLMDKKKIISIQNGVDPDLFSKNINKNSGQVIFVGNLKRFNKTRNIKFIIDCFENIKLKHKYVLKIIGGPTSEVNKLKEYVTKIGLQNQVSIEDRKDRKLAIQEIQKSEIGLLINSSDNEHSVKYTSPLKYFEYLYGGLKVLAVDFESHRALPFSNYIEFFKENNEHSFVDNLISINDKSITKKDLSTISLESRIDKILSFIVE